MDEELKVKPNGNETDGSSLGKIFAVIKRNVLLIFLIVAIGIGAGVLIAYLKKPTYTATNVVTFTARSTSLEKESITSNMDFISLNFKSVIDFCKSDVVADRADYYYANLLKEREVKANLSVNEYLKALEIYEQVGEKQREDINYSYENYFADKITASKDYVSLYGEDNSHLNEYVSELLSKDLNVSYGVFRYFLTEKKMNGTLTLTEYMARFSTMNGAHYNASDIEKREYIDASAISSFSSTTATGSNNNYINFFTITYKDFSSVGATEKLSVIDFAADVEINAGSGEGANREEYFNGITIAIKSSENPSIASDTSKARIVLIAALVGVVLSGVAVYIKHLFDNTVKDKNELESLTDMKVIAYISDREA